MNQINEQIVHTVLILLEENHWYVTHLVINLQIKHHNKILYNVDLRINPIVTFNKYSEINEVPLVKVGYKHDNQYNLKENATNGIFQYLIYDVVHYLLEIVVENLVTNLVILDIIKYLVVVSWTVPLYNLPFDNFFH